jgi:hypothetical protein
VALRQEQVQRQHNEREAGNDELWYEEEEVVVH